MKRGTSSGIIVLSLSIAGVAAAEPARAPTLSIGAGVAVADEVEAGFSGEPEAGGYVSATLAWDRELDVAELSGSVVRGDLVPELTLARFGDHSAALLGLRFEIDYARPRPCGCRRGEQGSAWVSPRLGAMNGADGAALGIEAGITAQAPSSRWSFGFWWGALTWQERVDQMAPAPGIGFVGDPAAVERERMFALTFGLTLGRGY